MQETEAGGPVGVAVVDCSALQWLRVISGWYHVAAQGDSVGLLKISVHANDGSCPTEPE